VARRIVTRAQTRLRDEYKLKGWCLKPPERRRSYFGWIDTVIDRLKTEWSSGEEPSDGTVLAALKVPLMEDDSFSKKLLDKGGDFLNTEENWDRCTPWRRPRSITNT